jgi:hypothetical protein
MLYKHATIREIMLHKRKNVEKMFALFFDSEFKWHRLRNRYDSTKSTFSDRLKKFFLKAHIKTSNLANF